MPVDSSDRQTDSGLSTFLNLSASQKMLALTWAGKAAISRMDQGQTETLTHTATLYTVVVAPSTCATVLDSKDLAASTLVDKVMPTLKDGAPWQKHFLSTLHTCSDFCLSFG